MSDAIVVDALGKGCPVPTLELAKAVEAAAPGAIVELLSDDAGAKVDIPVWCRMKHHEFVGVEERERGWAFRIRKAP